MKLASPLCAVALICGTAMGADYHWTGAAGDHLWSTAGNWTDSSGNAVAAPTPDTAYSYNFKQSAFADNAFSLVVTQDINVVFGGAGVAVHGAGSSAETTEVTFVSAEGCTLSTSTTDALNVYLYSNSRLTLATDMSADESSKDISKIGEGGTGLRPEGRQHGHAQRLCQERAVPDRGDGRAAVDSGRF